MSSEVGQISLTEDFAQLIVHKNVSSAYILVTADKLELCLIKHRAQLGERWQWATPAGILVTCVATLVATDFNDYVLSKATWHSLFVVATIVCGIWLAISLIRAIKNRNYGIEDLVKAIANSSKNAENM